MTYVRFVFLIQKNRPEVMHVPTFFAINAFIDGFRLIEDALIAGSNSIKYVLFKIIYLIIIMPNIKSNKY